jgi:phenylacetate-CoA ligase
MSVPSAVAGAVVYPLQERLVGRPTFAYLATLERSQWLDRSSLEALQVERLRRLLAVAHAHCPWHRQRIEQSGIRPEALAGLSDLRRLPAMTKQDAAAHATIWSGTACPAAPSGTTPAAPAVSR